MILDLMAAHPDRFVVGNDIGWQPVQWREWVPEYAAFLASGALSAGAQEQILSGNAEAVLNGPLRLRGAHPWS